MKTLNFFGAIILLFLGLCSQALAENSKTIVVYFSRTGNTEFIAEHIAEKLQADIFKVAAVEDYPSSYKETVDKAKAEKNNNSRPAIKGTLPDLNNYDTIVLGYPIWHGDLPMPMYTFLEQAKADGKNIVPICTHGGGGDYSSDRLIQKALPKSKVGTLLCFEDSDISLDIFPQIDTWLVSQKLLN